MHAAQPYGTLWEATTKGDDRADRIRLARCQNVEQIAVRGLGLEATVVARVAMPWE